MPGLQQEDLDEILKAVDQDVKDSIKRFEMKREDESMFAPPGIDEVRAGADELNLRDDLAESFAKHIGLKDEMLPMF
jgi:hypothetical protein